LADQLKSSSPDGVDSGTLLPSIPIDGTVIVGTAREDAAPTEKETIKAANVAAVSVAQRMRGVAIGPP
jgi:hypothetical protein